MVCVTLPTFPALRDVCRLCAHLCVRRQFHALYFHAKIAYWLNQVDQRIDNCDQRMTVECVQLCCGTNVAHGVRGCDPVLSCPCVARAELLWD